MIKQQNNYVMIVLRSYFDCVYFKYDFLITFIIHAKHDTILHHEIFVVKTNK